MKPAGVVADGLPVRFAAEGDKITWYCRGPWSGAMPSTLHLHLQRQVGGKKNSVVINGTDIFT